MSRYKQGLYKLSKPEKYLGDPRKVTFRSSWELRFFQFCENNPNVIKWGSEILVIPYIKATDGKMHRYFVDIYMEVIDSKQQLQKYAIEIKPQNQVTVRKNANNYDRLTEVVNRSKWHAAEMFCEQRGVRFMILTEHQLFGRMK